MDAKKRQATVAVAVEELNTFLEEGLMGNFKWFEAVEVIAFSVPAGAATRIARNMFSIYVAEPGAPGPTPANPFVNEKPWRLKGLDGWTFGITKRPVGVAELLACIEQYGREGVWAPPGQPALQVGELVAVPAKFCPSDSSTEVPLNGVLKNNFWSGSYVIELKDDSKAALNELVNQEELFDQLAVLIAEVVPLNLARVPDRIGDVLLQIPASALIAKFRRRFDEPVELHLAWNPDVPPRVVVGEYRVEHDGLISSLARFEFPVGRATLHIPPNSGDLRFSVWDTEKQVVLAATAVRHAPDGKGWVESSTSYELDEPRIFEAEGPDGVVAEHKVKLMEPGGAPRIVGRPRPAVDWVGRRELRARMKGLVDSKRFLQYGGVGADQKADRVRALDDIRQLIQTVSQGAVYLWDPYLSAKDILNTLAFCTNTRTELRGLTSSKPSKLSDSTEPDDGTYPTAVSNREKWMQMQRSQLDSVFPDPAPIRLEYRMSWGSDGRFHDRFLIFPSRRGQRTRAWSLGASINHIGAEHCIVQEVAYPEPVLKVFEDLWNHCSQPENSIWKRP